MSGTNHTRELMTGGPAIILVEPQLGENIGMVARAMANFGLSELRLVNPRDGWPSDSARSAASRADHVIDGTTVFETLDEAITDLNFVLATTARQRDMIKPVLKPEEACVLTHQRATRRRVLAHMDIVDERRLARLPVWPVHQAVRPRIGKLAAVTRDASSDTSTF